MIFWEDMQRNFKSDDHSSFLAPLGQALDPLAWILGEDSSYTKLIHKKIPKAINSALEPVNKFSRDYLDPIWILGGKNTDWGKAITDKGTQKGGDIAAIVSGLVLGAGALGGAGGGAGGGGSGGGLMGGSGGGSPFGQFGGMNPMSMMGGQPQQPQGLIEPRRPYRYIPVQSVYPRGLV